MYTASKIAICLAALVSTASAFTAAPVSGLGLRGASIRPPLCVRNCAPVTMSTDRVTEIKEVITELMEFRNRIVDDATELAKKVKAKPRDLRKTLESHADIIKVDQAIEQLEAELEALGASSKA